jgi:hypothetical protein
MLEEVRSALNMDHQVDRRGMDMRKYLLIGALALTLMMRGCMNQPEAIGGERDKHGCLGPAGYSYSEDIGACVRTWEIEDEGMARAAKTAVDYVVENGMMERFALTVIKLDPMRCGDSRCVGGYNVYLERTNDTIEREVVHLSNWNATSAKPYTSLP